MSRFNRRQFMKGLSATAGGAVLANSFLAHAQTNEERPAFLIVLCGTGGASILDSFLAIRASESANAATLNTFPDQLVSGFEGSELRAVDISGDSTGAVPIPFAGKQSNFVAKHRQNIMVATMTSTSVNHAIAQKRSITGNEAWGGRTLQEAVALQYGRSLALPNVNMATGSAFIERGTDGSLATYCYGEPVASPATWPLSLHGSAGLERAPAHGLIEKARVIRDEQLEPASSFFNVFRRSSRMQQWIDQRKSQGILEGKDLIRKLMVFADKPSYPLSEYGLSSSPDAQRVREVFPSFGSDPMQSQAALAFLLLKNRVSSTVTVASGFPSDSDRDQSSRSAPMNVPLGFDFSHQAHRATQAIEWDRLLRTADGLITLLKNEELGDGQSFWDRTMIYIATDFGRSKTRPANAEEWPSSHDLNNGIVAISPLVKGNTVLGGVDKNTGLTFGFDPRTGRPEPGRTMQEREIYAGLLQALGVDTSGSGLPDMPAMRA